MFSNIRQLRITDETLAPGTPFNRSEHNVSRFPARGQSGSDDASLQFHAIDDQRLTNQAESSGLVQKEKSWRSGIVDVNDQWNLPNPHRRVAARTFREPLAHIGVQDKRISRRQRAHAKSVRLLTPFAH